MKTRWFTRTGVRGAGKAHASRPSVISPSSDLPALLLCALDCPQVQCVEQYVAQQADELSLEPAEIINVIRKANEGTGKKTRQSFRDLFILSGCNF